MSGYAIRVGLSRGWIEFRASLTNAPDLTYFLMLPAVLLTVLLFQRSNIIDGAGLPLATLALPGAIGMLVAYGSMIGTAYALSTEREDGTLLRAKAVPNGMIGYVSGGILLVALQTVFGVLLVLVPGLFLFDRLLDGGIGSVLTLVWVLALGLLATLPIGMIVGSLAGSPRPVGGWGFLLTGGLVAISGIFYPISALPGWVQTIGQIFPHYWLGLGMRSALLPGDAVALEIGQSWRYLGIVGVLGAWAAAGLLIAPIVLRRMANRESGAHVEQRRQKALQRI
jgi:ABC-2 type transport system permease protein